MKCFYLPFSSLPPCHVCLNMVLYCFDSGSIRLYHLDFIWANLSITLWWSTAVKFSFSLDITARWLSQSCSIVCMQSTQGTKGTFTAAADNWDCQCYLKNSVWGTCQCLAAFSLTNYFFIINLFIELLPLNEYKSAKDYAIQTGYNRCLSLCLCVS